LLFIETGGSFHTPFIVTQTRDTHKSHSFQPQTRRRGPSQFETESQGRPIQSIRDKRAVSFTAGMPVSLRCQFLWVSLLRRPREGKTDTLEFDRSLLRSVH